jgi:multiple sugar transport system substrate-binding protein
MQHRPIIIIVSLWIIATICLDACNGSLSPIPIATDAPVVVETATATLPPAPSVELNYWLWNDFQMPAYQACATEFTRQHPNIKIKFQWYAWVPYWENLNTAFEAGNAPDVFTDHLTMYPDLLQQRRIMDIGSYVKWDNVDTNQYIPGLADLWVKAGKRYGFPKDWDAIGIYYNLNMFKKAGIDPSIMNSWTWNPDDGGTFQQTIARLTLDNKGRNGLDPNFDKTNVAQWGLISNAGDGTTGGQTQWASWAVSTGFVLTDGPWSTHYHYDDPRLIKTVQWWANLNLLYGYAPGAKYFPSDGSGLDRENLFLSGRGAMLVHGSWHINDVAMTGKIPVGIGKLPAGPEGIKTPTNSLSDAIWAGTKHPEQAWQWVKFLASPTCANIVGDYGVVFPAIQSGVDRALAKYKSQGMDVSAFADEISAPGGSFLLPITEHGLEIRDLATPAIWSVFSGQARAADVFPKLNEDINALFK